MPATDRRRVTPGRQWLLWVLVALLLTVSASVMGVGLLRGVEAASTTELRAALETPTLFDVQKAPEPATDTAPAQDYAPNTLAAPDASLTVPLEHAGLTARGDLAIPTAEHAGIFTQSAPLASSSGSTLIAGHVTNNLGDFAPMSRLALLSAGDLVVTVDADGVRKEWTVVAAATIPRVGLPEDLWQTAGDRKLVLVTCAGPTRESNGGIHFTGNLVVTAIPR